MHGEMCPVVRAIVKLIIFEKMKSGHTLSKNLSSGESHGLYTKKGEISPSLLVS